MKPKRVAIQLAAFSFLTILAACASVPLPEREGVELYRRKCSACHRAYAPSEITAARREKIHAEMEKRAKLTPAEKETIYRYLELDLVPSH